MRPRIVVVGAGFAGVTVAKELEDDREVTLVAPSDRFVYVPLIHEVASDHVAPTEVTRPLAEILPRTRLVEDAVARVDKSEVVTAGGERIAFDACVVAVGAQPNDFGVKGVREHALGFQSLPDAIRANGAVKLAASRGHARIVIVGAGFTGVELAGELHELGTRLGAKLALTLLDALPEIFPRQTPEFRARIREALDARGIPVRTGVKIVEVGPGFVRGEGVGEVASDVTFWCAGIQPRPVEGVDPNVRPTLQSVTRDDVFVVGDAAHFPKEMGVPQLAQTAEAQARVCAWNVLYPDRMRAYEPSIRGLIVSVGHHHAVAEMANGLVLAGDIPWHVKRLLYKAKIALA